MNFSQFLDVAHISRLNCDEIAGYRPRQDNLHIKSSALNVDFSSPSPDPIGSRRPAQTDVKDGYPLKVVILSLLARVAWKRLQIDTDMLLIITSTCDRPFRFRPINIDDLEQPWISQNGFFVNIFSQFVNAAHISTLNCDEMAEDRPEQPAYEIFSIKGRFRLSKSRFFKFKEAGAGKRQRRLPPKKWLFYCYWLV